MITDDQIKNLINDLIDFSKTNKSEWNDSQLSMRNHGIELAIYRMKTRLLNECVSVRPDEKYDLSADLRNELLTA
jgi:hypothetical protein